MGIFRFPKFRITCIIRNIYNQKREAALLSFCQIFGSFCGCFSVCTCPLLRRWTYYQHVQAFNLCLQYRFFSFGGAMLISPAAALCRSIHRWLHNKRVPQSCSHPHYQSAPHPRHSLQSTALPKLPDNPHLPAA